MPRAAFNYEPFKEQILNLVRTNVSTPKIARILCEQHGINATERTIERRLSQWGIQRRLQTVDSSDLRALIAILFRLNCTDEEILEDLQMGGYRIGKTAVTRIRKDLGLIHRMTVGDRARMDDELFIILAREVDDGRIEGYGRRLLHSYFKSKGALVSRYISVLQFVILPLPSGF
jgi:Clr5-like protein